MLQTATPIIMLDRKTKNGLNLKVVRVTESGNPLAQYHVTVDDSYLMVWFAGYEDLILILDSFIDALKKQENLPNNIHKIK